MTDPRPEATSSGVNAWVQRRGAETLTLHRAPPGIRVDGFQRVLDDVDCVVEQHVGAAVLGAAVLDEAGEEPFVQDVAVHE